MCQEVELLTFKVGDNAVYPGYGVGRVTSIEEREILGKRLKFYSLKILESGMKVMVPDNKVDSVGLRPIITQDDVHKVVDILQDIDHPRMDRQTWNRRHREYMRKIKTGSVFEIAEVLRDLFSLRVEKDLSFGEKNLMEQAKGLLWEEFKLAVDNDTLNSKAFADIFSPDEER